MIKPILLVKNKIHNFPVTSGFDAARTIGLTEPAASELRRAISRQLHPQTTRGTLNVSKRFRTQQTADSTCCFICGRDEAKTHGQSTMKKQVARTHKEAPLARKDKSNWQRKSYEPIDDSDAGDLIQVCPERNRLTLGCCRCCTERLLDWLVARAIDDESLSHIPDERTSRRCLIPPI